MTPSSRRDGTALIAAIVVLLILDCVVLGTLHLAVLEQRLAANVESALRLRLAAQAAAHSTIAQWPDETEDLQPGARLTPAHHAMGGGIAATVVIERAGAGLFLVRADAWLPAPLHGRGAAALLVTPPPLGPMPRIADAALTASSAPVLLTGGRIVTDAAGCPREGAALQLPAWQASDDSGSDLDVIRIPIAAPALSDVAARVMAALRTRPAGSALFVDGDHALQGSLDTVIVVSGDLHVQRGAVLRGAAVVGGALRIDAGGAVIGAVLVAGDAYIAGLLQLDACRASTALDRSALRRPRLLQARTAIPAF